MHLVLKITKITALLFLFFVLMSCASGPKVLTQNIPLSTDPPGAQVLVDGRSSCQTPCSVDLTRNQDHLLTFQKEGYRQQDVAVRRHHDTEMSLLKAVNSGVNSAKFFNNAAWGLSSTVQSLSAQQATGEAYVLMPSTVAVRLVPEAGFPRQATEEDARQSLAQAQSPLDLMDAEDEHMLETTLETTRTDHPRVWTNSRSGYTFAVEPEEAEMKDGFMVRYFNVGARKDGQNNAARYPAYRAGRAEWVVGLPPEGGTISSATTETRPTPDTVGAARALAQSPWSTVKKDWKVQESSHSTTTHPSPGSTTTTTRSSSTSVGVSVNPAGAALGILDALMSRSEREQD